MSAPHLVLKVGDNPLAVYWSKGTCDLCDSKDVECFKVENDTVEIVSLCYKCMYLSCKAKDYEIPFRTVIEVI